MLLTQCLEKKIPKKARKKYKAQLVLDLLFRQISLFPENSGAFAYGLRGLLPIDINKNYWLKATETSRNVEICQKQGLI